MTQIIYISLYLKQEEDNFDLLWSINPKALVRQPGNSHCMTLCLTGQGRGLAVSTQKKHFHKLSFSACWPKLLGREDHNNRDLWIFHCLGFTCTRQEELDPKQVYSCFLRNYKKHLQSWTEWTAPWIFSPHPVLALGCWEAACFAPQRQNLMLPCR